MCSLFSANEYAGPSCSTNPLLLTVMFRSRSAETERRENSFTTVYNENVFKKKKQNYTTIRTDGRRQHHSRYTRARRVVRRICLSVNIISVPDGVWDDACARAPANGYDAFYRPLVPSLTHPPQGARRRLRRRRRWRRRRPCDKERRGKKKERKSKNSFCRFRFSSGARQCRRRS